MQETKNELTEKQQENKREDKKALGKFAITLIIAFIIGMGCGVGSGLLRDILGESAAKEAFREILGNLAIYGAYVYTTVLLVASIVLYKKSRREYASWDEEDEDVLCGIETKQSYVLWFSNLILYGSYFFLSAGVWAAGLVEVKGALKQDVKGFLISILLVLLHIAYALVSGCIVQQKTVNFAKEINPEKNGSVYDMKFQDKWLENCDEAERYMAYKCSFKTFKVMQGVGMILWLICLIGQISFGTGTFATIIITIFMVIQVSVYSVQSIYFAKHPSEVMK